MSSESIISHILIICEIIINIKKRRKRDMYAYELLSKIREEIIPEKSLIIPAVVNGKSGKFVAKR